MEGRATCFLKSSATIREFATKKGKMNDKMSRGFRVANFGLGVGSMFAQAVKSANRFSFALQSMTQ